MIRDILFAFALGIAGAVFLKKRKVQETPAIAIKKKKSGREQWAYDGRFMYIPNFNSGKSETDFNKSAAQLGLTTIVFDSCYIDDAECRKNLKVNLDHVYWLP
jgi:hypothetical protein